MLGQSGTCISRQKEMGINHKMQLCSLLNDSFTLNAKFNDKHLTNKKQTKDAALSRVISTHNC
jgi:hypothetical protein